MRDPRLRPTFRQLKRPQEAHARPHNREAFHLWCEGLRQDLHSPFIVEKAPEDPRQGCPGDVRQRRGGLNFPAFNTVATLPSSTRSTLRLVHGRRLQAEPDGLAVVPAALHSSSKPRLVHPALPQPPLLSGAAHQPPDSPPFPLPPYRVPPTPSGPLLLSQTFLNLRCA